MAYSDKRAVEKYKEEHPNTKLSDKEIKKMLKFGVTDEELWK
jgi:cephalosporin hydroxylase